MVACQGERGAYGHLAIDQLWGGRAWVLPCWSFGDVIAAVERGSAGYAVLPVHNEIIGAIPGVREAIEEAGLEQVGEVRQAVRHCLLGSPGSTLVDISAVYSHPAALAQCRASLPLPGDGPARGVRHGGGRRDVAARGRRHEAAIASEGCAERYGLQLLARDVGDRDDNATTFAILRRGS
ncbi:MAG: hypothetical protein IPF47_20655 [Gemmatimonadetes bacterium]|nr:hypothetical protein [Gemmatimonadota bacterium]